MKGGIPKDNGVVQVAVDLDEDTGTDVWVVMRCRAEDSIRHNETGEITHALRIQTIEATTSGAKFATELTKLHDDMREARTGSRQMQLGEADEGIPGASTGDESEAERQARLFTLEQEAAEREAQEDAAAAEPPSGDGETAEPEPDGSVDPGPPAAPPAQFSGSVEEPATEPAAVDEVGSRRTSRSKRSRGTRVTR